MNYLDKLKIYFNNAFLANKKFLIIPYYIQYYNVLHILLDKKYINNFICFNLYSTFKCYILIELIYINFFLKTFKIFIYKKRLKNSLIYVKNIINLQKFSGLFIFNTSKGMLTLDVIKILKIGGKLCLYII